MKRWSRASAASSSPSLQGRRSSNRSTDPLWEAYRDYALPHELRACWSTPIFDAERRVLGTFALYFNTLRRPDAEHLRIIESATHIAAIAIAKAREERALRASNERLHELSRRVLEVQETERRALARELHDEVGGTLTAIKLNLHAQQGQLHGGASEAALADGLALVDGLIKAVRSLSLDLRPSILDDLGLIPALRWYCEQQAARSGVPIELVLDAVDLKQVPQLETASFRIVQEAVTNALRHARAGRIDVALGRADDLLTLGIADDGCGFDVGEARARAPASGNNGLLGMEERALLLGGRLTIDSEPGAGTRVRVAFPVPEDGFA